MASCGSKPVGGQAEEPGSPIDLNCPLRTKQAEKDLKGRPTSCYLYLQVAHEGSSLAHHGLVIVDA